MEFQGLKSFIKTYSLEKDLYRFTVKNGLIDVSKKDNPAEITQGYMIDIDGFVDTEHTYDSILPHTRQIREQDKKFFRGFITDELHKLLDPTTKQS